MFIYRFDFLVTDSLFNGVPKRNSRGIPTGNNYLSDTATSIETVFKSSSFEEITINKANFTCSYIDPTLPSETGSITIKDSEPITHTGVSFDGEDSDATSTITISRKSAIYPKIRNKGIAKQVLVNIFLMNKTKTAAIRVFEGFLETSKLSNNFFNYELTFSHFLKNYDKIGLDSKFSRNCNVPVFSKSCRLKYYDKDSSGNNKYYHKFSAIPGTATSNKGCLQFNATLNDTNTLPFVTTDYEGGYIKLAYTTKNVVIDHDKPSYTIPTTPPTYTPTTPIYGDLLVSEYLGDVFSITKTGSIYTIITRIRYTDEVKALIDAGCNLALLKSCDGKYTTCKTKFANTANYRGYPYLPDKNVFTDGLTLNDNLSNLING